MFDQLSPGFLVKFVLRDVLWLNFIRQHFQQSPYFLVVLGMEGVPTKIQDSEVGKAAKSCGEGIIMM